MKGLMLVITSVLAVFTQCATTSTPPPNVYVPRFDFTPPAESSTRSAGLTFALVNTTYSEHHPWTMSSPFDLFASNMSNDFQEMLLGRGFSIKGPFSTYDHMTFPDKQDSDLVLIPTLDVRVDFQNVDIRTSLVQSILAPGNNLAGRVQGVAVVRSQLTLVAREPLTMENMWIKNLSVDNSSVSWVTDNSYTYDPDAGVANITLEMLLRDQGFVRAFGPEIERVYDQLLTQAWNQIDPDEMRMVAREAQELKEKKRY